MFKSKIVIGENGKPAILGKKSKDPQTNEEILKGGLATPDINLVIEMISEQKKHEKFMANKAQKMPSIEE